MLSELQTSPSSAGLPSNTVAGPSTPIAVPTPPASTLKRHMTVIPIEGIVPTLQNIVASTTTALIFASGKMVVTGAKSGDNL
ncbi:hypothetical protein BT96DRAFT_1008039 [Gymnopus androsaceus JB14]|uniref:Uncharacterized protein n=1 Tax=Gymnopus androsaceus JB14 TaxID=1447944 RepID=A0A6A4GFZ3_9AGAR|nr:hypothetical protein BT96DRAFT_1008039 [Gymnopus androsaceus JB14]